MSLLVLAGCETGVLGSVRTPVASVAVTPDSERTEVGESVPLAAVVSDADGNELPGREVFWASEDSTVASVSPTGQVLGRAPGTARIVASSEGESDLASIVVVLPAVASVRIEPASITLTSRSDTARFTATALDAGGDPLSGKSAAWSSSRPEVAGISSSGVATAVGDGITTITAGIDGITGTATLTVARRAARITVTPPDVALPLGNEVQLSATATDAGGSEIPSASVRWESSNTAVAPVSESGVVTGESTGEATITASSGEVNGTATITVVAGDPARLEPISGDDQEGTIGQPLDEPLVVRITDADGNPLTGIEVAWNANDGGGSLEPASVRTDADGLARAEWTLGTRPGQQRTNASVEGLGAVEFTATARPGAISSISVQPASVSLTSFDDAQQFTATAEDMYGNVLAGTAFEWSSSETAVASIDGSGLAVAHGNGETTITAEIGEVEGTATLTVNQQVANVGVNPSNIILGAGDTQQLEAAATDAGGSPVEGAPFAWESRNEEVATVDNSGVVTGVRTGSTAIVASSGGEDDFSTVTVEPGDPASIEQESGDDQAGVVGTLLDDPLVVYVEDANGNPVAGVTVTWTSDGLEDRRGELDPATSETGENGMAQSEWTLGEVAGEQTATAAVSGLEPVVFTATAEPGPPAKIEKIGGDGQTGLVGEPLDEPLIVQVLDKYDNPLAGYTVIWVSQDGGYFNPVESPTDSDGQARTEWLITRLGLNEAVATVENLNLATTFTATGNLGGDDEDSDDDDED